MAKFKKARRYARRAYGKVKSYSRNSKGLSAIEATIGGAGYGAVRNYAVNLVPDIAYLGGYSDKIVLGGLGALAAWKGKGMIKKAGLVVLASEAFVASSRATQGMSAQTGGSIYIN